jgi:hypothetical protein
MGVELANTNVEGGVGIEMVGLAGSGAVRVMEVGPPEPPCGGRLQSTVRCGRERRFVVSGTEKARW